MVNTRTPYASHTHASRDDNNNNNNNNSNSIMIYVCNIPFFFILKYYNGSYRYKFEAFVKLKKYKHSLAEMSAAEAKRKRKLSMATYKTFSVRR